MKWCLNALKPVQLNSSAPSKPFRFLPLTTFQLVNIICTSRKWGQYEKYKHNLIKFPFSGGEGIRCSQLSVKSDKDRRIPCLIQIQTISAKLKFAGSLSCHSNCSALFWRFKYGHWTIENIYNHHHPVPFITSFTTLPAYLISISYVGSIEGEGHSHIAGGAKRKS